MIKMLFKERKRECNFMMTYAWFQHLPRHHRRLHEHHTNLGQRQPRPVRVGSQKRLKEAKNET